LLFFFPETVFFLKQGTGILKYRQLPQCWSCKWRNSGKSINGGTDTLGSSTHNTELLKLSVVMDPFTSYFLLHTKRKPQFFILRVNRCYCLSVSSPKTLLKLEPIVLLVRGWVFRRQLGHHDSAFRNW
jgi:hypothetical protein